jgi:uncharacterized protein YjbI with pentapeptide repeats
MSGTPETPGKFPTADNIGKFPTGKFILSGLIVFVLIILGYTVPGTGFAGGTKKTEATTETSTAGTVSTSKTQTMEEIPAKTIYDWLDLLIVPGALAVGAYVLDKTENKRKSAEEERVRKDTLARSNAEREQGIETAREAVVETYIDRMAELIAKHTQGSTQLADIGRIRTLTALRRLDSSEARESDQKRRAVIIQFLYEAELITGELPVIPLEGADLTHIDLNGQPLIGINLSGAVLNYAHLEGADLSGARLKGVHMKNAQLIGGTFAKAHFENAVLNGTRLEQSDLTGAILRDATLFDAHLRCAKLDHADLTGAKMADVEWDKIRRSKAVTLPTGITKDIEGFGECPHETSAQSRKT